MNRPRDDEFTSLDDLLGSKPYDDPGDHLGADDDTVGIPGGLGLDDPADVGVWGGLPGDLHAGFLQAYRRGYERARHGEDGQDEQPTQEMKVVGGPPSAVEREPVQQPEPTRRIEPEALAELRAPAARAAGPGAGRPGAGRPGAAGTAGTGATTGAGTPTAALSGSPPGNPPRVVAAAGSDRSTGLAGRLPAAGLRGRLPAAGLVVLALVVIAGAFGVGRMLAGSSSSGGDADDRMAGVRTRHGQPVYQGPLRAVPVADAMATCQTGSSVDAAGQPVTYEPAKAYDANRATAWRCDGSGAGQKYTVSLPGETVVAKVGLVPGYAKTDPASGADRYAENNRITKVRWRFDDGTTYVQRMSGDPASRRMRSIRIPKTTTRQVVLEILASQPGPRNTVAISELRIASPRH